MRTLPYPSGRRSKSQVRWDIFQLQLVGNASRALEMKTLVQYGYELDRVRAAISKTRKEFHRQLHFIRD